MTAFQKRWLEIAGRFGLKVRISFRVDLGSDVLTVPVLVEEFGPQRGMLLVTAYEEVEPFTEKLVAAGFGYSCLSDSSDEDIDEDQLVDMLQDWGWSGAGAPPGWYAA
jgi:hypothetical protein